MSLELETLYLPQASLSPETSWYRKKAFADLQVVCDESAIGTYYLLQRQLESLGCLAIGRELASSSTTEPASPIRIYAYTSDGGSDQTKYKKLCGALVEDHPLVLFLSYSCQMHCCQLIVKTGLNVIDTWFKNHVDSEVGTHFKYFATLAKICATWRDSSRAVFRVWSAKYGDISAFLNCRRLIPRCVAGRWGSIAEVETFLAGRQISQVINVVPAAFGFDITGGDAFDSTDNRSEHGDGDLSSFD